ncbi:hypothetical protein AS032_27060 [Rhodococcus qingshengii]|nr:hypothetical protein AOT96_31870 [Rhodococcus sp. 008]KSU70607.1 hypothetical protein AS032_27060 [Rhodococcus qingshengii]
MPHIESEASATTSTTIEPAREFIGPADEAARRRRDEGCNKGEYLNASAPRAVELPTGTYHARVIRTAAKPGFSARGRTMASIPVMKRKNIGTVSLEAPPPA